MPATTISNGVIENVTRDRENVLITVAYGRRPNDRRNNERIRLVVGPRTLILNRRGMPVPPSALRRGMVIDARISSAMTRSIPPQANAFFIRIMREDRF